ncbi:MAG TPA: hypothetical protein VKR05_06725 [Candidatus Cybelea sp.]|nr:hypothetical protein [Candidatus Cybelea sp.]
MKFHLIAYALALAVLAGCASNAGGGGSASTSALLPAGGSPVSYQYTVEALDPLGGTLAGANSINNQNWASGISTLTSGSYFHAALWENGGAAMDLGTLGGPNSGVEWPNKSDRGLIAGISETSAPQKLGEIWSCALAFFPQPPSGHICLGFAWRNGAMSALPTLGGNNGFAAGANEHGDIVGWAETRKHDSTCTPPQVLQFEAVRYDGNGRHPKELRPLRGDSDGAATEINDRGDVVGISGICDQAVGRFTARHAVMWHGNKPVDLGSLGGVAWNTPMAINDRGVIVGFSDLTGDSTGTPNFHAFLWTKKTGMQDLGTLPGDTYSEALGVNEAGQVVGESFSASSARAFIWQNGTMTDLNTLIPPSSGLYLLYANDVNDQGDIAGGACVVVSDACSSSQPAYVATPTGSAARVSRAVKKPALPPALLRLLHRRAIP